MAVIVITDEGSTPATPTDGIALYSVTGILKYRSESGTIYQLARDTDLTAITGGASVSDQQLKDWAAGECYEITAVTYDSDGVPTTATVKWPDASAGTFTTTTKNTTWLAVDAFTISHTTSGKTVTQAAVTRDGNGQITVKPALTVA